MGFARFAIALVAPMSALTTPADDPPVRVKLSDDFYIVGERARVSVKTEKDGYLVVMRVDTEGRIRVIYPVNPGDKAEVKGGKSVEIRSRGDRDAFTVAEKKGSGVVFAARSDTPFNFAAFTTNNHWNLEALAPGKPDMDPEAALLDIADRMGAANYDYDALPYTVGDGYRVPPYAAYDPWYAPRVSVGVGFCRGPCGYFGGWSPFYGPGYGYRSVFLPVHRFYGRRH